MTIHIMLSTTIAPDTIHSSRAKRGVERKPDAKSEVEDCNRQHEQQHMRRRF